MASRYLLIEFDDEQQATNLRAQIDNASRKGKRFRVVGLFAKPTNYCQCNPERQVTQRGKPARVKRGAKFGWFVCLECKRPTSTFSFLTNLLKPSDIIDPPVFDAVPYKGNNHYRGKLMHHFLGISAVTQAPPQKDD